MNTVNINRSELAEILAGVKGCKFASVDAFCEIGNGDYVGGKTGNPMCGKGFKMHEGVMMLLGASYERMVSKRTEAAGNGEFKAGENWHEKVAGGLYRHKTSDAKYLGGPYAQRAVDMMETDEVEALAELRTVDAYENIGGKTTYFAKNENGGYDPTTKEALNLRSKGRGGAQGGLAEESKVIFRMFKLENITALRLNGVEYKVN
jgi:hypothetical protein